MKKALGVLGVVGLAVGGAFAGNVSTGLVVNVSFDQTTASIGETITGMVTASWNGVAGSYFSSINIDLIAHGDGFEVSNVAPVAWNNPALGFNGQGTASGADILGLQAAQFSLIPPFTPDNPLLITTFTLTRTSEAGLYYTARTVDGAPFPFSVTGPMFDDLVVPFGEDALVSEVIPRIPAPGAAGLLGVAGLMEVRRRR